LNHSAVSVGRQWIKKEVNVIASTALFSKSARIFCATFALISILDYFSGAEAVFAAEAHHPFATFNLKKMDIDIEDGEVDMLATFTLGAGSGGIDLAKDAVSLQVTGGAGAYSVTIPAGSFKAERGGAFKFLGTINRVKMDAALRPVRGGGFEFEIETEGANLKGFSNPVTVNLTIGDDGASKTVKAEIE
jgi:hypothetical protein